MPELEPVGYIIELENNDPEDTYQHKLTVSRCRGCAALVLSGETGHVCPQSIEVHRA